MQLSRTTALAALVLVALAAPASAFALAGGDGAAPGHHTHPAGHATTAPDDSEDAADPSDDAADDPSEGPDDAPGAEHPAAASAPGRAHAAAMQAWAHCVAEAASGPKTGERTGPPKLACGDKPLAPGRAKHDTTAPAHPSGPGTGHGHGKSHGGH